MILWKEVNMKKWRVFLMFFILIFDIPSFADYQSRIIMKLPYGSGRGQVGMIKSGARYYTASTFAIGMDGTIIIGDSLNNRILTFDKTGKYLSESGKKGTGDGEFNGYIKQIDSDAEGNIFAIDYHNYRIEKFDRNGKYLTSFRSRGADPNSHSYIEDIKVAKSGRVYVSDRKEGTQVYSTNGDFIQGGAAKIIEDRNGNIYKRTRGKKEGKYVMGIEKYVQAKGVMTIQSNQAEKTLSISPTDSSYPPQDVIGFDDSGNFFVLMTRGHKEGTYETMYFVKKYDSQGNFIQNIDLRPLVSAIGGGRRFLITGDGSIYQMNQLMDGIEIIKYSKE